MRYSEHLYLFNQNNYFSNKALHICKNDLIMTEEQTEIIEQPQVTDKKIAGVGAVYLSKKEKQLTLKNYMNMPIIC